MRLTEELHGRAELVQALRVSDEAVNNRHTLPQNSDVLEYLHSFTNVKLFLM